jgi:hypothetical protein
MPIRLYPLESGSPGKDSSEKFSNGSMLVIETRLTGIVRRYVGGPRYL